MPEFQYDKYNWATRGEKGSGTKSSLLWETVRITKDIKPKYVIWENVKNVLCGKHRKVFLEYLEEMELLGYNNYTPKNKKGEHSYLNSKDFGIPQSRDRVFVVSIRKDIDDGSFMFPEKQKLTSEVRDYMDFREKDNITKTIKNRYEKIKGEAVTDDEFVNYIESLPLKRGIGIKKLHLYSFNDMDDLTTVDGLTGTLTRRGIQNQTKKFWWNNNIYKPSPRMCFRLMGFQDSDFDKIKHIGTDSNLWDRAGNSIVVNVVEAIFKNLFKKQ